MSPDGYDENSRAAQADQLPLHKWQREVLEERLSAHRRAPTDVRPWDEVLERLKGRLRHYRP
jgi:hypothetical protein